MQKTDKLISANALLEKVQYRIDTPGIIGATVRDVVATTRRIIEEAPAALQWFSVTERLPEDDLPQDSKAKQIKVLVAYMRNGNWVVRTNLRKKGQWYKKPDEWSWSVSDPITHWMRLPEPPEKEG